MYIDTTRGHRPKLIKPGEDAAAVEYIEALEVELQNECAAHERTTLKGEQLASVLGNLFIHIHELGLRKADGIYGQYHYRNERAEKAEAELESLRSERV